MMTDVASTVRDNLCVLVGDIEQQSRNTNGIIMMPRKRVSIKERLNSLRGLKISPAKCIVRRHPVFVSPETSEKVTSKKFPWIHNPDIFKEYTLYEKSHCEISHYVAPAFLIGIAIITQFLLWKCEDNNHYFGLSLAFTIIAIVLYLILLFVNWVDYLKTKYQRFHTSWLGRSIEDLLSISSTLMFGFMLYGRVENGQCNKSISPWNTQSCNPSADSHSLPHAQILLLYLSPIIYQLCFKGISVPTIFVSWGTGVAFVLASLIRVSGWQDIPSLLFSIFFLHIDLSMKEFSRNIFMETRKAAAAELSKQASDKKMNISVRQRNEAIDSKLMRECEISEISNKAKEDKWFMDKEREALTSLIGNVAHDLKTPLQSFRMDLELLKTRIVKDYGMFNLQPNKDDVDDDHPITTLSSLNAACDFMSMAINRSIDFAKASGNIALVPAMETFNIAVALSIPVSVIKHLQSAMNIIVDELPPKLSVNLISDKHWFSENVLCLLSNAVKYSDGGTVRVTIELLEPEPKEDENMCAMDTSRVDYSSRAAPNQFSRDDIDKTDVTCASVRVSIEDTGIGLSKETRDTLFQPFKQAQRMAGGTGLGLFSLSKRMEALGGSRGVEERKDGKRGSIFWFSFPYRPDLSASNERYGELGTKGELKISEKEEMHPIKSSLSRHHFLTSARVINIDQFPSNPNLHVMLIDDSLTIIKVAGRSLRQHGYHVTTANNGSAGLDRLIQGYALDEFDFVLMDLQMPVMDGIEAVRRYREFEKTKRMERKVRGSITGSIRIRLPIIGMSANSDSATKQCAMEAGMDRFIAKPFILPELLPLIGQVLSPEFVHERKAVESKKYSDELKE